MLKEQALHRKAKEIGIMGPDSSKWLPKFIPIAFHSQTTVLLKEGNINKKENHFKPHILNQVYYNNDYYEVFIVCHVLC